MVNSSPDEVDLRRYVTAVWRRRWIIVTIIAIALAGTAILRRFTPPTYQALALIQLSEDSEPPFNSTGAARMIIDSDPFLRAVREKLDASIPVETVRDRLRIDVRDPLIVRLTSRGPTAQQAHALGESASAIFLTMASTRIEAKARAIRGRLSDIDAQIAAVRPALRQTQTVLKQMGEPDRRGRDVPAARMYLLGALANWEALLNTLLWTRSELTMELADLQLPVLIAAPALPAGPAGAHPKSAFLLAGILGLIMGITVAAAWDFFSPATVAHSKGVTSSVISKELSRDSPAED